MIEARVQCVWALTRSSAAQDDHRPPIDAIDGNATAIGELPDRQAEVPVQRLASEETDVKATKGAEQDWLGREGIGADNDGAIVRRHVKAASAEAEVRRPDSLAIVV
jgi:hypothetical protein